MSKSQYTKYPYPKSLLSAIKGEEYTDEITEDVIKGLDCCISLLSEKRQFVLLEKFKNRKTDAEIANNLGISMSGPKQLIDRTLREIRYGESFYYAMYGIEGAKNKIDKSDVRQAGLSVRTMNCLLRGHIRSLAEVKSIEQLRCIRNMGNTSIAEVLLKMRELGLELPK